MAEQVRALGPRTQHPGQAWPGPRAGRLRSEFSGGFEQGFSGSLIYFPVLKAMIGSVGFPQSLGSPWYGQRKGRALRTAWPTSEHLGWVWGVPLRWTQLWVLLSRGTCGFGAALHLMRIGNSDNRYFFSLGQVVGKCLECGPPGISRAPGLLHSVNGTQQLSQLPGTDTKTGAFRAPHQPFSLQRPCHPGCHCGFPGCTQNRN